MFVLFQSLPMYLNGVTLTFMFENFVQCRHYGQQKLDAFKLNAKFDNLLDNLSNEGAEFSFVNSFYCIVHLAFQSL